MKNRIISVGIIILLLISIIKMDDVFASPITDAATETDADEDEEFNAIEKIDDLSNESIQTNLDNICLIDEIDDVEEKSFDRIHYLKIHDNSAESNDAILIESNGHFGLIDSSRRFGDGSFDSPLFEGSGKAVWTYMKALGVKHLDCFLGTHSHMDHMGGIHDIVTDATNEGYYSLIDEDTTYIYKSYTDTPIENAKGWKNRFYYEESELAMSSATKLLVDLHTDGMDKLNAIFSANGPDDIDDTISFSFGDYNIVLYNLYPRTDKDENANSIVTYIEKDGIKTLLTADIDVYDKLEQRISKTVVSQNGIIDVMKVPHHGWTRSTSKEMIDTLGAKYSVISTNYVNSSWYSPFYGYMTKKGIPIYRTMDVKGNAIVQDMTDGILTFKEGTVEDSTVIIDGSPNSWKQEGKERWDKWWIDWNHYDDVYINSDGTNKTGWNKIGGYDYYFDESGIMQTGWNNKEGKKVYLCPQAHNGRPKGTIAIGWTEIDGKQYYFNENGLGKTGWVKTSTDSYYFVDGLMSADVIKNINGYTYYFDVSGKMKTGWVKYKGNRYYFDSNGKGKTGWLKELNSLYYIENGQMNTKTQKSIDGQTYYFDSDGKMITGWFKKNGGWHYLDDNGKPHKGWILTTSGWYYTDKDGKIKTSQWIDNCWLSSNGCWSYLFKGSWKCNAEGWWYEDADGWYPKSQWQKIDGKSYYFENNGYMAVNQWVDGQWIDGNGYTNYKYKGKWHANSTGWWYGDSSGWYAHNGWQKINGSWYYFDSDGYMVTNTTVDGFEIGEDGVCK